jgi:hypothetical protein
MTASAVPIRPNTRANKSRLMGESDLVENSINFSLIAGSLVASAAK